MSKDNLITKDNAEIIVSNIQGSPGNCRYLNTLEAWECEALDKYYPGLIAESVKLGSVHRALLKLYDTEEYNSLQKADSVNSGFSMWRDDISYQEKTYNLQTVPPKCRGSLWTEKKPVFVSPNAIVMPNCDTYITEACSNCGFVPSDFKKREHYSSFYDNRLEQCLGVYYVKTDGTEVVERCYKKFCNQCKNVTSHYCHTTALINKFVFRSRINGTTFTEDAYTLLNINNDILDKIGCNDKIYDTPNNKNKTNINYLARVLKKETERLELDILGIWTNRAVKYKERTIHLQEIFS